MLSKWYGLGTNCRIASSPQYGKTTAVEYFIRKHIRHGNGVCGVDFHHGLYRSLVKYLSYLQPYQPVYLMNFTSRKSVNGFNPFKFRGGSVAAHVSRLTNAIISAWGELNTNQTPRLERMLKMVLTYSAVSGEPLHHACHLLDFHRRELRERAIAIIPNEKIRQDWRRLQYLSLNTKNHAAYWNFLGQIESTDNKLQRFVDSEVVQAFLGSDSIDLERIWDEQAILLVDASPSEWFSEESSKLMLALLMAEFDRVARKRMTHPKPFYLYLDEFQKYFPPQMGTMIDELLKSGLRMTFIHHHDAELNDPHLISSLKMGAQIELVFGGLPPDMAKAKAEELFFEEANRRWKKEDKVHYVTDHYEDSSFSMTEGENERGEFKSTTIASRLTPYVERIVDGQEDFTREQVIAMLSERLTRLKKRECYVKLPGRPAFFQTIPWIYPALPDWEDVVQFIQATQPQLTRDNALRSIGEKERHFLEGSVELESGPRKKKPARLHPQG